MERRAKVRKNESKQRDKQSINFCIVYYREPYEGYILGLEWALDGLFITTIWPLGPQIQITYCGRPFWLYRARLPLAILGLVRTYVFHMLRTYVMILYNWLILWQNALYLYLGRFRMSLNTSRNLISRSSIVAFKSVKEKKFRVQIH